MINWQRKTNLDWRLVLGLILFILLVAAVLGLMIVEARLGPVLQAWAETTAVGLATTAINSAVEEILGEPLGSMDLAQLIRDSEGRLQGVQYNMAEVNKLSSRASQRILENLNALEQQSFAIPLGQLTGLGFLAARGPGIPVRMVPLGTLKTSPGASFSGAGLNQTWHRVFLDVQVTMRIAAPFQQKEIVVATRVPLVEEIFMGAVPNLYFTGQSEVTRGDGYLEFPLN